MLPTRSFRVNILILFTALLSALVVGCGKQTSTEGLATDSMGSPLVGVTIVAKQLEPIKGFEVVTAVTSKEGSFSLSGLYPNSDYDIHAEGNNWISHPSNHVTITSGPKGETSLLAKPYQVTMAVNEAGSLVLDLETGICRFEKSSDGFITDATTALQWYVLPGKVTWFEAQKVIQQMGDGWRFPRMNELKGLYIEGLGECNSDPLFGLKYGDMWRGDFYGGCVWSDYLRRLPFNLTISRSFRFPYGDPSPNGGDPDAVKDKMRAFAVRNLEG